MRLILLFILLLECLEAKPQSAWEWALTGYHGISDAVSSCSDDSSNIYTVGTFFSTIDIDPGPNVHLLSAQGQEDIFIIKCDSAGNLIWAYSFGNSNIDVVKSIMFDGSSLFVTGTFLDSIDFDISAGNTFTYATLRTQYILKLSTNCEFIWVKLLESISGSAYAKSISNNDDGDLYITGSFTGSVDFNPSSDSFVVASKGQEDLFLLKLDHLGEFKWINTIGGGRFDTGCKVITDNVGGVFLFGQFRDTVDIDPGLDSLIVMSDFVGNILAKFDSTGQFLWGHAFPNILYSDPPDMDFDDSSNLYLTGVFYGLIDFDAGPGAQFLGTPNYISTYIIKYDSSGYYKWGHALYNPNSSQFVGTGIAVGNHGVVIATGYFFDQADFDFGSGSFLIDSYGFQDGYVLELSTDGDFIWATSLQGDWEDTPKDICYIPNSGFVITGSTGSSQLIAGNIIAPNVNPGFYRWFVAKLDDSQPTANITRQNRENDFRIFPNPASCTLHVKLQKLFKNPRFEVLNNLGQTVLAIAGTTESIDISQLCPGLYILKASDGEWEVTEKFVVL